MQRVVQLLVTLLVTITAVLCPVVADAEAIDSDTCWATGDINGNTIPLEISDWVYLENFVAGLVPPPDPLYEGDLNADGFIDQIDAALICSVVIGEIELEFPILTICSPDTTRGGCPYGDTCFILSPVNCAASGGSYLGDGIPCNCDCGVWGDITGDGAINPLDVVWQVLCIYLDGACEIVEPPNCPYQAGDVNCDGNLNPVDVVFYVNYVYLNWDVFCPDPCGE